MADSSSNKQRSEVWKYFSKVDKDGRTKVQCKLCNVQLSYAGGSTGTMANHLKHIHKSLKSESSKSESSTNSGTVRQTSIKDFKKSPFSRDKWMKCTEKLAYMCAQDLRPISIVEGEGFKAFCRELNPNYDVPTSTTISNYITKVYDTEKTKLIEVIKEQVGIALTYDHWTSLATESYITVTGHFIDDEWRYQNCVLATRMVTERHTGENTANEIRTIASAFGITDQKVSAIVTDNASNMVVCCQHLQWPHVRCFGHTLQLSIRKGFDNSQTIKNTIASCKKLVKHFRKSVVVSNALVEKQRQMGVKENSLIIDCETRWNSTYDMFARYLEQQLPVYAVLHDPNITKIQDARLLDLTEDQVKVIEGLVPVLKPLYLATAALCSEEYPTVGGVYPILFSLVNHHLNPNDSETPAVRKFKSDVRADIVKRHGLDNDDICSSIGMICTFLDPRYRSLPFLTNQQREIVYSAVREKMNELQLVTSTSETVEVQQESQTGASVQPGPSVTKHAKLTQDDMSFLLGGYFADCEIVTPSNASEELNMYKSDKPSQSKINPFKWWRESSETFPTMAALARKLTCVPATSVPSERVFSLAGGTVTKLRASLDPDSVDKLVFIHK